MQPESEGESSKRREVSSHSSSIGKAPKLAYLEYFFGGKVSFISVYVIPRVIPNAEQTILYNKLPARRGKITLSRERSQGISVIRNRNLSTRHIVVFSKRIINM